MKTLNHSVYETIERNRPHVHTENAIFRARELRSGLEEHKEPAISMSNLLMVASIIELTDVLNEQFTEFLRTYLESQ